MKSRCLLTTCTQAVSTTEHTHEETCPPGSIQKKRVDQRGLKAAHHTGVHLASVVLLVHYRNTEPYVSVSL